MLQTFGMCDCTTGQVVPNNEKDHSFAFHLVLKIRALLFLKNVRKYNPNDTVYHLKKLDSGNTTLRTSNPVIFTAEQGKYRADKARESQTH
jgi:hypothetical protein